MPEADDESARLRRRYERERARRIEAELIAERATRSLYQSKLELERSNEDLERFAFLASHDLKEPLRVITMHLQWVRRKGAGSIDPELLPSLEAAARRGYDLVSGLLEYARVNVAPRSGAVADAGAVVRDVIESVRPQVEEHGGRVTAGDLPRVAADPLHLMLVFQNLVSNALKFRGPRAPEVHVGCMRVGERWEFTVRDNGIGIEPGYHDKVFVLFQRLHPTEFPGTGLGLALCRSIVTRYGGEIWVESDGSRGTAVHFTLPAADV